MDGWDWALLVGAAYIAVLSLVRLMRGHRDRLMAELQQQLQQQAVANRKTSKK